MGTNAAPSCTDAILAVGTLAPHVGPTHRRSLIVTAPIAFDNSYARLPERFFARVSPASSPAPGLIRVNRALAHELGLDPDWLESGAGLDMIAGRALPSGADPIATAYAGHQFGNFVPQLGEGRGGRRGEAID